MSIYLFDYFNIIKGYEYFIPKLTYCIIVRIKPKYEKETIN